MILFPSACIWEFKEVIAETLVRIRQTAFHYIDVEPEIITAELQQKIEELGLKVSCVALDHHLPGDSALDGGPQQVRNAVAYVKKSLEQSQTLGARYAYVAACSDARRLETYRAAVVELADEALKNGIKLCIEPGPGKALPDSAATLAFLEKAGHPNLHFLLDTGHALLSRAKPQDVVRAAGIRLGYVQMNDNDGRRDRHWALLDGRFKEGELAQTLEALREIGYEGTLGLELSGKLPMLMSSLAKNRNLLMRLQAPVEVKSLQEPEARRK
ncbi:MAG: sugar phosphate isomerase/epimerase [Rubrivivax sp.]|nr:sugar phosphate isomerase/epimerase [Rubrivivax sp.]